MRWLLALSLVACSSTSDWSWDKVTYQTRPLVIDKLHAAGGNARLFVGNRYFIVRENALQPEIRAVLSATAAAVQAGERRPEPYDEDWRPLGDVVAMPRLDRALQVSDVGVERIDGISACYRVTVQRAPEHYIKADVPATESIDRAFEALIAKAVEEATLCDGDNVGGGPDLLTGIWVDVIGGSGPPLLEEAGAAR